VLAADVAGSKSKASLFGSVAQLLRPVRAWRRSHRLAESAVEVRLRRKSGGVGDVDQQPIARQQQPFGEIEALAADVFMRRRSGGRLEAAREVRRAHARHRRQFIDGEGPLD
jgi:hypothetical protein